MLPAQRNEVFYTGVATDFLNELVTILNDRNYLGFLESALDDVTKMIKLF